MFTTVIWCHVDTVTCSRELSALLQNTKFFDQLNALLQHAPSKICIMQTVEYNLGCGLGEEAAGFSETAGACQEAQEGNHTQ